MDGLTGVVVISDKTDCSGENGKKSGNGRRPGAQLGAKTRYLQYLPKLYWAVVGKGLERRHGVQGKPVVSPANSVPDLWTSSPVPTYLAKATTIVGKYLP